jgi:hypothetical protein
MVAGDLTRRDARVGRVNAESNASEDDGEAEIVMKRRKVRLHRGKGSASTGDSQSQDEVGPLRYLGIATHCDVVVVLERRVSLLPGSKRLQE